MTYLGDHKSDCKTSLLRYLARESGHGTFSMQQIQPRWSRQLIQCCQFSGCSRVRYIESAFVTIYSTGNLALPATSGLYLVAITWCRAIEQSQHTMHARSLRSPTPIRSWGGFTRNIQVACCCVEMPGLHVSLQLETQYYFIIVRYQLNAWPLRADGRFHRCKFR